MQEALKQEANKLVGLLDELHSTDTSFRSARATMATIKKALDELSPALWPQVVKVEAPVPDKVTFTLETSAGQHDLLFHFRADGIYFDGERQELSSLTTEGVQTLVIGKLTAYVSNVLSTAATASP